MAIDTLGYNPETEEDFSVDSEPRETLSKVGKAMVLEETKKSEYSNIPGADRIETGQEISWENLVFVRTTDIAPRNKAGKLVIETPYSGTKDRPLSEVDPRTTTHWTVNHHVRATAGGWRREGSEELPFIIIVPAKGMIELNAVPRNFADVDTFWDKDLVLPEGTTIVRQPGVELRIPGNLKGKIRVVDRDTSRTAETDIADIVARLGFTPIKGGQKYSRTEGVAEVFNDFAEREKLSSGIHQLDETNRFESKYSQLDDPEYLLQAIGVFLAPGYKPANEQIGELLERKLKSIAKTDRSEMERLAKNYKMSLEEIEDIFGQAKYLLEDRV